MLIFLCTGFFVLGQSESVTSTEYFPEVSTVHPETYDNYTEMEAPDPDHGSLYDYEYDYDYSHHVPPGGWPAPDPYPYGGGPDYTCFYYYYYKASCYPNNATAFPGVSWKQLDEKWRTWWDYPCFYYTEEALLAASENTLTNATFSCDGHSYRIDQDTINIKIQWWSYVYESEVRNLTGKLRSFFRSNNYLGS